MVPTRRTFCNGLQWRSSGREGIAADKIAPCELGLEAFGTNRTLIIKARPYCDQEIASTLGSGLASSKEK
jgi:hypothetical protein